VVNIYLIVVNKYMFFLLVFLMVLCIEVKYFRHYFHQEDLNLGYKHGSKSVIEYRKSLGQTPISLATQVNQMNKETAVACL
jgi:hypothetical protein